MPLRRVEIREIHDFSGEFPEIETYEHIDVALLEKGDDEPFYIILPIARAGQVSANKIRYDETLVREIENQLPDLTGIRGHLTSEETATAFPIADVYWVGHKRINEIVWAKGYIPIGENREDLRIRKATKKGLRTSVYVWAYEQFNADGTTSLLEPDFDAVDLAPPKRASLKVGEGDFDVVQEMEKEGSDMPSEVTKESVLAELKAGEVPDKVREQIIREAKVEADAKKVSELESQLTELRQYATVYGTIRGYFPSDLTDEQVAQKVQEMQSTFTKLTETLGISADICVQVEAYHMMVSEMVKELGVEQANVFSAVKELNTQVTEFKKAEFGRLVDSKVAELTKWGDDVRGDEAKKQVKAFRELFHNGIVQMLGGATDEVKVKEVTQALWDSQYSIIGESIVKALAGPNVLFGRNGVSETSTNGFAPDEKIAEDRAKTGI